MRDGRRRMLAVAFGPSTMAEALRLLPRITAEADCVELRLDLFREPFELPRLLRARGDLPAVVTLRPTDQGGKSTLAAADRLRVLLEAAELGAEYVDLEFDAVSPEAVRELQARGASVIVSRHDFAAMPSIEDWWGQLAELGGNVVKVVGTAHDVCDNLAVLRVLEHADRPTISIAMGAAGQLSRVLVLRSEQCLLTYAAIDDIGTAPGQLGIGEMREAYAAQRLGGTTRVYGLLGPHDEAARLREYNAWFTRDNVDAVALPFQAHDAAAAIVRAYRELPVSGWHVHGESLQRDVVGVLDALHSANGRANAIVRARDGSLHGHWVESPREQYDLWLAEDV